MKTPLKFNYDYASCMVMKLGMAYPEKKITNKSHVELTFAQALEYIKKIDNITQGITKIYYLVGWQYLGHDDKYPDFFEVNEALKRPEDKTAYDSFKWLAEEAKKYHSVISVHINFNDAYDNAPSFNEFVKANALIRKKNGKIDPIENYNGRKCYKTCHKTYWESGLFKKMFDKFVDTFPFIAEAGTIHVDNFQCYKNYAPYISIKEMQNARREMIKYVHSKGIDITSEFTYKESESLPNKPIFGLPRDHFSKYPHDTVGLIPLSWWCYRLTPQELEEFIHRFATYQVPCHFLNSHKRLAINGKRNTLSCIFSDNIISYAKGEKITRNNKIIKDGDTLLLPFVHKEKQYIAYSSKGDFREWDIFENDVSKAKIYRITEKGNKFIKEVQLLNHKMELLIKPKTALLIVLE